jgi:ubiquinone/menaquinone biosynthesis C-methylase UbiE
MEKKYVYEVYEKIADHFSETRYKPWPQVVHFLKGLPKGSVVCDVGCGNGKYLGVNPELVMIGTDITHNLLKICQGRNQSVFRADSLALPMKTSSVDFCISIAVIHHFSNPNLRRKALEELLRVVKPGGRVLVTVWALEQNKKFKTADVFVPWNLTKVFHKKNENTGLEKKAEEIVEGKATDDARPEVFRDDEKKSVVYKRYYHLFVFKELESLLEDIGGLEIVESFYDRDNWCVVFQKNGGSVEEVSASESQ